MAELVVSEFMTLDGVFEDPGGAEALTNTRPAGDTLTSPTSRRATA